MKLSSTINAFIVLTFLCTTIFSMEEKKDIEEKKIKATLGILGMQDAITYDDNLIQCKPSVNLELYLALPHDLLPALPIPTFPFSYIPTYSIEPEKMNFLKEEVEKEKIKNKKNE